MYPVLLGTQVLSGGGGRWYPPFLSSGHVVTPWDKKFDRSCITLGTKFNPNFLFSVNFYLLITLVRLISYTTPKFRKCIFMKNQLHNATEQNHGFSCRIYSWLNPPDPPLVRILNLYNFFAEKRNLNEKKNRNNKK